MRSWASDRLRKEGRTDAMLPECELQLTSPPCNVTYYVTLRRGPAEPDELNQERELQFAFSLRLARVDGAIPQRVASRFRDEACMRTEARPHS